MKVGGLTKLENQLLNVCIFRIDLKVVDVRYIINLNVKKKLFYYLLILQ